VVSAPEEGEIKAAALAFDDVLVLLPLLSRAQLRFELFPEFFLHYEALIRCYIISRLLQVAVFGLSKWDAPKIVLLP